MRWRNVVIRLRPGARNVTLRLRERLFSGGRCVTCARAANSTSFTNSSQHHQHQHHHIQQQPPTAAVVVESRRATPTCGSDEARQTCEPRRGCEPRGAARNLWTRTGEMLQRATTAPSALAHDSRHQPVAVHLDTSPSRLHVI